MAHKGRKNAHKNFDQQTLREETTSEGKG